MRRASPVPEMNLSALLLFRNLTTAELALASEVTQCELHPPGRLLIGERSPSDKVYFLVQGTVRIVIERGDEEMFIGIRGDGEIFGEIGALDGFPRQASAYTHTRCSCFSISTHDFHEVLLKMPSFSRDLNVFMASRVRRLVKQVEAMATLSVQARLAQQLINLSEEYGLGIQTEDKKLGSQIPFRLTQTNLSHLIGATRVHVNQIFCTWKEQRIIEIQKSRIVICDMDALRAFIR